MGDMAGLWDVEVGSGGKKLLVAATILMVEV
jgi:hypothetical protein